MLRVSGTLQSRAVVPSRGITSAVPRSTAGSIVRRAPAVAQRRLAPCCASETEVSKPVTPAGPVEYVEDNEFAISKVSFGSILSPLGSFLLLYGFGAFFTLLPGGDVSSLLLIYGFPMTLLGFALSYAQLEPAPCKTTKAAFDLRAKEMTDIQKQIREDTTRYRYGDEQHLEEALERIFLYNTPNNIRRRDAPKLVALREEVVNEHYCLTLEFEATFEMDRWEAKQAKFQSFFGPGITAELAKTDKGCDVYLISDGSGDGITGIEKPDALIPLLPGLKPRQQK